MASETFLLRNIEGLLSRFEPIGVCSANIMNALDRILEMLVDGEWHRVEDLSARLGLPEQKLKTIAYFLSEHGFVHYRESDSSVRIESQLKALMES